ncbi:MAG: oligosaccharide flippase family protein [Candidatus Hydrogenedentota bacterium]
MTSLERTAKHTVIYMLGLMANRGVAFLLVPLYTRTFEPSVFATWDLATTTIIFLIPLFELGMASALVRYYHFHDYGGDRRKAIVTAFTFVLSASLIFCGLALAFAPSLAAAIFGNAELSHLVELVAVTVALTAVTNQFLSLLRAQEKSIAFSALNLVRAIMGPASILLLILVFDFGLPGVLWGDIIGIISMGAAGLWLTRRDIGLGMSVRHLRSMLAFGLPLIPWTLTISIITLSDRYFLRAWSTMDELAVYSLGAKIGMIMTLFTRAFQTAWPASAYSIAKEDDAKEQLAKGGRYVFAAATLLGATLALAAPELVAVFGGSEFYTPSIHIVPWVIFSYALYQLTLVLLIGITITHRTYYVMVLAVGAVLAKLLLSFVLIPRYGADGAALSTFGSFCLLVTCGYIVAQRVYFVPYSLKPIGLFACVLGLCTVGAFSFADQASLQHATVRLVLLIGLFVAAPAVGLTELSVLRKASRYMRLRSPI